MGLRAWHRRCWLVFLFYSTGIILASRISQPLSSPPSCCYTIHPWGNGWFSSGSPGGPHLTAGITEWGKPIWCPEDFFPCLGDLSGDTVESPILELSDKTTRSIGLKEAHIFSYLGRWRGSLPHRGEQRELSAVAPETAPGAGVGELRLSASISSSLTPTPAPFLGSSSNPSPMPRKESSYLLRTPGRAGYPDNASPTGTAPEATLPAGPSINCVHTLPVPREL